MDSQEEEGKMIMSRNYHEGKCDACGKIRELQIIKVTNYRAIITVRLCIPCYNDFQRKVDREALKILTDMIEDFNPSSRGNRKKRGEGE